MVLFATTFRSISSGTIIDFLYCLLSQVPPAELESLLISHSAIEDAAVIGVPDDRAGELPKAFVVKKENAEITEEEIVKYIEERVAPHKALRGGVEFIDKIPRSLSGKILRRELKARVTADLKNMADNRTKEEEENVIRSKNPDVDIPDNVSWTEFVFKHFDEYEDREAIVSFTNTVLYCLTSFKIGSGSNRFSNFYRKRRTFPIFKDFFVTKSRKVLLSLIFCAKQGNRTTTPYKNTKSLKSECHACVEK